MQKTMKLPFPKAKVLDTFNWLLWKCYEREGHRKKAVVWIMMINKPHTKPAASVLLCWLSTFLFGAKIQNGFFSTKYVFQCFGSHIAHIFFEYMKRLSNSDFGFSQMEGNKVEHIYRLMTLHSSWICVNSFFFL